MLFYFILFGNVFCILVHDYSLCFTGSACCNVSYYNYISILPYYTVIHIMKYVTAWDLLKGLKNIPLVRINDLHFIFPDTFKCPYNCFLLTGSSTPDLTTDIIKVCGRHSIWSQATLLTSRQPMLMLLVWM